MKKDIHIDHDAFFFSVVDLDTEEDIEDIIWADDETGEYEQHCRDENDNLIIEKDIDGMPDKIKSEVKKGNIVLVDERVYGEFLR